MSNGKKKARFFTTFTTAFGPMGVLAGDAGLTRVILPHYGNDDLAAMIQWENPKAVREDSPFETLMERCRAYFNGQRVSFEDFELDIPSAESFAGKVYRACQAIPYGQTCSYKELAMAVGQLDAARAVATMMSKNALPLIVPCHRVIYADGRLGGFSADGGTDMKRRMQAMEKKNG